MNKQQVKQLIAKNRLEEAIFSLLSISKDTHLHNDVIIQSRRLSEYKTLIVKGTENTDTLNRYQAQIAHSLLIIIDALPNETNKILLNSVKSRRLTCTVAIAFATSVLAVFASLAEFTRYNIKDIFTGSSPKNNFTLTILVHGYKSNQDIVKLDDNAQVMIDFDGNRRTEKINERGEATFKNILPQYFGQKLLINLINSNPYIAVNPDSTYKLTDKAVIYLPINSKGLNKLYGIVQNKKGRLIENVTLMTEGIVTTTDSWGRFELHIPIDKQAERYNLVARYKGNSVWSNFVTPQTGEIVIIID